MVKGKGDIAKCEVCGTLFVKTMEKHTCCSRKCYKKKWRKGVSDYPFFHCSFCGFKFPLNFYPKKNKAKWTNLRCPKCGKKRVNS